MSSNSPTGGSEYRFRELTSADLPEVRRLAGAVPEGDNEYPITLLAAEMAGEREPEWVTMEGRRAVGIFDPAERLVGVGCATPGAEGRRDEGYISRVYVAPEARRKGLGRELARRLEGVLLRVDCRRAFLYCWSPMYRAISFWLSCGFARTGTVALAETDEGFVVRMARILSPRTGDA